MAFCWHATIASLGDDSVSYLTLARWLSPFGGDPLSAPWARYHSHFPPLFPLLLALTGGAWNLLAAHIVVAVCGLAALFFVYRFAGSRLGTAGAILVTLLFLASPTAWVSLLGILSEPLYLAISLAALCAYEGLEDDAGPSIARIATFALLVALAQLTRVAAVALIAAYAVHLGVRAIARRELPALSRLLPVAMPLAAWALWIALRPAPQADNYGVTLRGVGERWLHDPAVLATAWDSFLGGWVASFTGDSAVGGTARIFFAAVGLAGVCGAVRAAARNRLDGWYVLASLAMLFAWVFPEEIMRRLFYPLLPILLVQAAEVVAQACRRLGEARSRRLAVAAAWGLVAAMMAPASFLVARKAFDREPLFPDSCYELAGITDYYTTLNVPAARLVAGEHAAVLAGLEALDRVTPTGARVMWMRPEYVAVVGKRESLAWILTWDRIQLARHIRDAGAGYLVVARLFKNDLAGNKDDAFTPIVAAPPPYLRPKLVVPNPASGRLEFVLLEVDRALLERYLANPG